jgi:hypothetical protein
VAFPPEARIVFASRTVVLPTIIPSQQGGLHVEISGQCEYELLRVAHEQMNKAISKGDVRLFRVIICCLLSAQELHLPVVLLLHWVAGYHPMGFDN